MRKSGKAWGVELGPHSLSVRNHPLGPEGGLDMVQHIKRFLVEEEGATALEYGLLAALIAAAIVTAVTNLGNTVSNTFTSIANDMANATAS